MVVELEAQPQQQPALEHARRHARVADGAEQDRVVPAQLAEHRVGQHLAGAVPARGAQVVRRRLDAGHHLAQDLEALRHHLGADAVAGDHREPHDLGGYPTGRRRSAARAGLRSRVAGSGITGAAGSLGVEVGAAHVGRADRGRRSPASSSAGTALSTVSVISASPPASRRLTCIAGDVDARRRRAARRPRRPRRAGRRSGRTAGCPPARSSRSKPSTSVSFSTCSRRRSDVPDTLTVPPSGSAPRTVTRLRWSAALGVRRQADLDAAVLAASSGALT